MQCPYFLYWCGSGNSEIDMNHRLDERLIQSLPTMAYMYIYWTDPIFTNHGLHVYLLDWSNIYQPWPTCIFTGLIQSLPTMAYMYIYWTDPIFTNHGLHIYLLDWSNLYQPWPTCILTGLIQSLPTMAYLYFYRNYPIFTNYGLHVYLLDWSNLYQPWPKDRIDWMNSTKRRNWFVLSE